MIPFALCWLVCINTLAGCIFRLDKIRAIKGGRRMPEADLLGLALIGGSPAILVARQLFRHKTRKQPFSTYLMLIAAVQAAAGLGLLIW